MIPSSLAAYARRFIAHDGWAPVRMFWVSHDTRGGPLDEFVRAHAVELSDPTKDGSVVAQFVVDAKCRTWTSFAGQHDLGSLCWHPPSLFYVPCGTSGLVQLNLLETQGTSP
jgi:hypothetical protein